MNQEWKQKRSTALATHRSEEIDRASLEGAWLTEQRKGSNWLD